MIEVPPIADDGAGKCAGAAVDAGRIIRPRMEEIFEMLRARLQDAGSTRSPAARW